MKQTFIVLVLLATGSTFANVNKAECKEADGASICYVKNKQATLDGSGGIFYTDLEARYPESGWGRKFHSDSETANQICRFIANQALDSFTTERFRLPQRWGTALRHLIKGGGKKTVVEIDAETQELIEKESRFYISSLKCTAE